MNDSLCHCSLSSWDHVGSHSWGIDINTYAWSYVNETSSFAFTQLDLFIRSCCSLPSRQNHWVHRAPWSPSRHTILQQYLNRDQHPDSVSLKTCRWRAALQRSFNGEEQISSIASFNPPDQWTETHQNRINIESVAVQSFLPCNFRSNKKELIWST